MGLAAGRILALEGAYLIAPGVDPLLEITGQALHIYQQPAPTGPTTGPGANTPWYEPQPGLPLTPPPPLVHVYFDSAGRLDASRHAGAVQIHLVSGSAGSLRRAVLTFHPLGVMTHEFVERFDWEDRQ
jgi:hypothetical protein